MLSLAMITVVCTYLHITEYSELMTYRATTTIKQITYGIFYKFGTEMDVCACLIAASESIFLLFR